jgi:hypothetical protein
MTWLPDQLPHCPWYGTYRHFKWTLPGFSTVRDMELTDTLNELRSQVSSLSVVWNLPTLQMNSPRLRHCPWYGTYRHFRWTLPGFITVRDMELTDTSNELLSQAFSLSVIWNLPTLQMNSPRLSHCPWCGTYRHFIWTLPGFLTVRDMELTDTSNELYQDSSLSVIWNLPTLQMNSPRLSHCPWYGTYRHFKWTLPGFSTVHDMELTDTE